MSTLIFNLPIKLGNDRINAGIYEHHQGGELYYSVSIPAIKEDKHYYMFIEPYGDVYFSFDNNTPKELLIYEHVISKAIFNYYY